jgi:GH43 family beta-xylosidase
LAKILLEAPDVLVLDEPTNYLDVAGVEWLEGWFRTFKGAAIIVSYDRVGLRSAGTLGGLDSAAETIIWHRPPPGPLGGHTWAPELHHFDGQWHIYFAAGDSDDLFRIRMYVMSNPGPDPAAPAWGPPARIADPLMDWEIKGHPVNEGPAVIERNGRIFLTFSASATDANSCVGLLTADSDADLLDPSSWTKSPLPVLASSDETGEYGPGHNSFTVDEAGNDVIVYRARSERDIKGNPLHEPNRHTRSRPVVWSPEGWPRFPAPSAA